MSAQRIATRYAKSLLDLASDTSTPERVLEDVKTFLSTNTNRDFQLLLKSPIVSTDKKQKVMEAIFGPHFDKLSMQFVQLVVQKKRESFLPEIMNAFEDLYRQRNHMVQVKITSAETLSDASLQAIRQKVSTELAGKTVELVTSIDPSLIGGFVLEYGDKRYDASVLHNLETLGKAFKSNDHVSKI